MSRIFLLTAACVLSGCSLIFGVDPDQYPFDSGDRADSGLDGGTDAGDGGTDAGDAGTDASLDGWICPRRFERECAGGEDEDCDGLIDCNDSDCATSLACCSDRAPLFDLVTFDDAFPSEWTWIPISDEAISQGGDDWLHDFGTFDYPRAVRVDRCLPIDLGVRITASMLPLNLPPMCPGSEPSCANYATLLVTESTNATPPETLAENFAVRVYHNGRVEIRAAGKVLMNSAVDGVMFNTGPTSTAISLRVELTPGVQDDGLPYVFARVELTQGRISWPLEGTPPMFLPPRPIFPREYLRGSDIGCSGARGLLLAFEGRGDNVRVDNVGVALFGCANPAHFEAAGAEIDADDADGPLYDSDDWTAGGLGSPSVQSFFPSVSSRERTEIFYDASNRDRTLEPTDGVRYSIGGSYTTDPDGVSNLVPRSMANPILGLRPPDCIGTMMPPGGCDVRRSWREPALFVPVDETRTMLVGPQLGLVYARETGPLSGVFELGVAAAYLDDESFVERRGALAASGDGCTSRRDPVLLPTRPGGVATDRVVLYTCERAMGPSSIRGLQLREFPPGPDDITPIDGDIIAPGAPGTFSGDGVRAADAAVWFREAEPTDQMVVRVWYVSEARSTDPATISFAEGSGPQGQLPALHPYPANPVLRSNDPVLGACDAVGDCQIESVAVTRLANEPDTVRLLVSRTLETSTGIRHVLVPLNQVWPPLR